LEAEVKAAVDDREEQCEKVRQAIPNAPNTDLVNEINSEVRIQRLADTKKCPAKHLKHKGQMEMAERERVAQTEARQQLLDVREQARANLPSAIAIYEATLSQMRAQQDRQDGVEELNAGCNVLDAAELDVEQAEADLATANWEWETYVSMVNQPNSFVVKVTKSAGAALCIVCAQHCYILCWCICVALISLRVL
jgi:hypothetical protein